MPVLDILYKLGDAIADRLAEHADEITVQSWHGYWVGICTQAATVPRERHEAVVGNMAAALQVAFTSILPNSEEVEE